MESLLRLVNIWPRIILRRIQTHLLHLWGHLRHLINGLHFLIFLEMRLVRLYLSLLSKLSLLLCLVLLVLLYSLLLLCNLVVFQRLPFVTILGKGLLNLGSHASVFFEPDWLHLVQRLINIYVIVFVVTFDLVPNEYCLSDIFAVYAMG